MEFNKLTIKKKKITGSTASKSTGTTFSIGKVYMIRTLRLLIPVLKIPQAGKVCMLGTHTCHSFSILEEHFGEERCIGYDLYNPTKRRNITEKPINQIDASKIPQLSFCWNDIGNYSRSPGDKMLAQIRFAAKVMSKGCFIGRDGSNRARFPVDAFMEELGCKNLSLYDFFSQRNIDTNTVSPHFLKSHLRSFRI